jgi:hypothetical protein
MCTPSLIENYPEQETALKISIRYWRGQLPQDPLFGLYRKAVASDMSGTPRIYGRPTAHAFSFRLTWAVQGKRDSLTGRFASSPLPRQEHGANRPSCAERIRALSEQYFRSRERQSLALDKLQIPTLCKPNMPDLLPFETLARDAWPTSLTLHAVISPAPF